MIPLELQVLAHLPIPVMVIRDQRFEYVNGCWERMFGRTHAELVGTPVTSCIPEFVVEEDRPLVLKLKGLRDAAQVSPEQVWLRLKTVERVRLMRIRDAAGPRPGDLTLVFLEADEEAKARQFTEALVDGGARLLVSRDENEVLEIALDVLWTQQMLCKVMVLDAAGTELRLGAFRHPPDFPERLVEHYQRLSEIPMPLETVPFVQHMFDTGRALFHQDMLTNMSAVVPEQVLREFRARLSTAHGMDAPIFVDGMPFGVLAVLSPMLSPSIVATLELFAREIGNALENVRHHRLAAERLSQVRALQDELVARERLAVLGEAAAVLAHEVRNPLGTIVNTAALIRRAGGAQLDPSLGQMLEEESLRLEHLVRALLDFSRPLQAHPRMTSLGERVQETVTLVQKRTGTAAISCQLPPEPLLMRTDGPMVQMALENLLRNAHQATGATGEIEVHLSSVDGGAVVRVSDDGSGISPTDRDRIFEPFFTTRATGSGLGLTVVKRIAEVLGGRVELEAAERGACFRLFIPDMPAPG